VRRHLRFGWWSLVCFGLLGLSLELMHAFKVGFYLDVFNESRRLMWTLAHAHGVLLGLVHVAYAATLRLWVDPEDPWRRFASALLIGASLLLPGGFFLGGVVVYGGDPSPGVLITPVGAALFLAAAFLTAMGMNSGSSEPSSGSS
jgi:hypothetical protein